MIKLLKYIVAAAIVVSACHEIDEYETDTDTDKVWRCYDIDRDEYWIRYVDNSIPVLWFASYDEMSEHIEDAYGKGEYVPERCDYREFEVIL